MIMTKMRVDKNQASIVKALRRAGCTVQILAGVGFGCPDLLCGYREKNVLIEIKNPAGRCDLTEAERRWIEAWAGQVAICRTSAEVEAVLEDICGTEE
jgi:hypothetical protein